MGFRRPNFVVGKGLLILKEGFVMYLLLSLNKKLAHCIYTTVSQQVQVKSKRFEDKDKLLGGITQECEASKLVLLGI